MKVGLAVYELLNEETTAGTRVFPELAPEGTVMPYIVYSVVSNQPSDAKDGTPIDEAQVEIYSVANSYSAANVLADAVRAQIDRKSTTVTDASVGTINVQSVVYTNEIIEVSQDRKTYIAVQDYTFRIKR